MVQSIGSYNEKIHIIIYVDQLLPMYKISYQHKKNNFDELGLGWL
jgi:hypothetical protein